MKHLKLIIISFFLVGLISNAQKLRVREALNDYSDFSYVSTISILESLAEKGYESPKLYQKLGNANYFNNKMEAAAKWYGKLISSEAGIDSEYYWRYAQALKGIGNYEESDKWMARFNESNPEDLRSKAFTSKVDYLAAIESVSRDDIEIINLDLNTALSDFGTTQYKDAFIFASNRSGGKLYKWNAEPYLDLFTATKTDVGVYTGVKQLNTSINTEFHESTAAYTPDDAYMFFTRNNYYKKRYKEDASQTNRLQLYRASQNGSGDWGKVKRIHFNSNDYSVAHPSINASGDLLYFASDMPGSIGDSDIYVVDLNQDGTLGTPVNLGKYINTQGRESFPFINDKGDLYYASNGYPGLGGLDIFVVRDFESKFRQKSTNYIVENLGKPINSKSDDFGYYENLIDKEAFFTSNRAGGKGGDDIYTFAITEAPKPCLQEVTGVVKDKQTGALIPDAAVTLLDNEGEVVATVQSDAKAAFSFADLTCDANYVVRASKATYTGDEKLFSTPKTEQALTLELMLEPDVQEIKVGDDLAKVLDIPMIYFDFNKSDIRYDAALELQKILSVMLEYPTMIVDIRSHTDCRASRAYNRRLSDSRAKSTRSYLISKGISSDRLTAMGYGESNLLNGCACEPTNKSSCSEEEHQLNRRSEFIIIKM